MNQITRYCLPAACFLLLTVFFLLLPDLRSCDLGEERQKQNRLTRFDALAMALLTLAYGAVAFVRLGDRDAPQTFVNMEGREAELTLDINGGTVSHLMLYTGVGIGGYDITYTTDGSDSYDLARFEQSHAEDLKWQDVDLSYYLTGGVLRIRGWGNVWLGEVVALTEDNQPVALVSEDEALCDEQGLVPAKQNFMNSSYFDEIYHARTAWEHLNRVYPYEITHPPLGKIIIGLGISLFGMTPFGWRFSGTLFGVLMLPVLYVFARKLFRGRTAPAACTALMATDFMHFVQTRIATIDTYGVFFILLMYYFLLLWLEEGSPWALALCGLSFGLGAASKWTGLYAGAGLAVLWAAHWVRRAREHTAQKRRGSLFPAFLKNVGLCLLVFIALPCLIYYLSYLPYGKALGQPLFSRAYLKTVLDNQRFMFTYHAGIVAEHPYSSRWYQWLLDIRPILYYLEYFSDGRRISIAAFLNPALCWGGFLSLFVLLYTAIFRRDRRAAFLLVGYLAQLLPWVFIARLTFAYHYFPSSVFLVLALGYVFALYRENKPDWLRWVIPFAAVSLLLFVMFYPVLAGAPVDNVSASRLLAWFPTWPI